MPHEVDGSHLVSKARLSGTVPPTPPPPCAFMPWRGTAFFTYIPHNKRRFFFPSNVNRLTFIIIYGFEYLRNYSIVFLTHGSVHHNSMLTKIQPDATVCRYLFIAKSLYMFRVSQHPSSGVLKTVTAASGTGHNIGTATSLPIRSRWREVAVPIL